MDNGLPGGTSSHNVYLAMLSVGCGIDLDGQCPRPTGVQLNSLLSPCACAAGCGIDFEGIPVTTKLVGHTSQGMRWTGFVVENRYGSPMLSQQEPWKQGCTVGNSSVDVIQLNAISGSAALLFNTTVDSANATATIEASDTDSSLLALKNFYVMSVTVRH